VDHWSKELRLLTTIATSQPHAAYAACTHGFAGKWSHVSCTTSSLSDHIQHLENIIRPIYSNSDWNPPCTQDHDHDLFALPARLGVLGLRNPAKFSNSEYSASKLISEPLVKLILEKRAEYTQECFIEIL